MSSTSPTSRTSGSCEIKVITVNSLSLESRYRPFHCAVFAIGVYNRDMKMIYNLPNANFRLLRILDTGTITATYKICNTVWKPLYGLDKSFDRKNCQHRGKCHTNKYEIGFYDPNQSSLSGQIVPISLWKKKSGTFYPLQWDLEKFAAGIYIYNKSIPK